MSNKLPRYMYLLLDYFMLPLSLVAQAYIFGRFASSGFVSNPQDPSSWGFYNGAGFVILFLFGMSFAGASVASAHNMVHCLKSGKGKEAFYSGCVSFVFVVLEILASLNDRDIRDLGTPLNDLINSLFGLHNPAIEPVQLVVSVSLPLVTIAYILWKTQPETEVKKPEKREHVHNKEPTLLERAGEEDNSKVWVERAKQRVLKRMEISKPTEGITLGFGNDGPIIAPMEKILSISIIGKPGMGKSSLLRFLFSQMLAQGMEGYLFDPHNGFSDLSGRLTYARDASSMIRLANGLGQELEARKVELDDYGEVTSPPLFLGVDELPIVAELGGEKVSNILKRVLLEGRKYKMFLIVAGQGLPTTLFKDGKSMVRDSFGTRYFFYCTPDQASMGNLSREGKTLLPELKGKAGVMIIDADFRDTPEIVSFPPQEATPTEGKSDEEISENERELILEQYHNGKRRSEIPGALNRSARFYTKVKRVIDEVEGK